MIDAIIKYILFTLLYLHTVLCAMLSWFIDKKQPCRYHFANNEKCVSVSCIMKSFGMNIHNISSSEVYHVMCKVIHIHLVCDTSKMVNMLNADSWQGSTSLTSDNDAHKLRTYCRVKISQYKIAIDKFRCYHGYGALTYSYTVYTVPVSCVTFSIQMWVSTRNWNCLLFFSHE